MTEHDRWAIAWRGMLLMIPIAIAANNWRHPHISAFWDWVQAIVISLCIVQRERISYNWRKRELSDMRKGSL